MHVVCLGLDPKTLDSESVVAFRNRAYGELVEHYSIVVPSPSTVTVHLSDRTTVYGVGGRYKALQLFRMFRRAQELIRSHVCDVITSQDMYFLGLLGLYLARRYHLGLEVQVLGIEKLTPFRKRIACFVLRRASVVRALSERIKERLIHEFGIPEDTIEVVTIYVDVNKLGLDVRREGGEQHASFEQISAEFRSTYGSYINFLTVSRLVPIKRIELQLMALSNLCKEQKRAMLHIVGAGPTERALRETAEKLGVTDSVVFHGYQTGYALGMFYVECDCFLLTSDYEGWGMVIIEAAIAGLPIIMTDVGCAGEFIQNEISGLIVSLGSVEELQNAMKRVIDDIELRERLSLGAMNATKALPQFDAILSTYRKNWERAYAHRL